MKKIASFVIVQVVFLLILTGCSSGMVANAPSVSEESVNEVLTTVLKSSFGYPCNWESPETNIFLNDFQETIKSQTVFQDEDWLNRYTAYCKEVAKQIRVLEPHSLLEIEALKSASVSTLSANTYHTISELQFSGECSYFICNLTEIIAGESILKCKATVSIDVKVTGEEFMGRTTSSTRTTLQHTVDFKNQNAEAISMEIIKKIMDIEDDRLANAVLERLNQIEIVKFDKDFNVLESGRNNEN